MNRVGLFILCLLCTGITFAQQGGNRGRGHGPLTEELAEKVEGLRIAYMTERLELSLAEAEKFWPLFRAYRIERDALEIKRHPEDISATSDEELVELVSAEFYKMEELVKINRNYLAKFQTEIGKRKGALVFILEHEFKRYILSRSRDKSIVEKRREEEEKSR